MQGENTFENKTPYESTSSSQPIESTSSIHADL